MKNLSIFLGLFIALFLLTSTELKANHCYSIPGFCVECICPPDMIFREKLVIPGGPGCLSCPHEIFLVDNDIYLVIEQGRGGKQFVTNDIQLQRGQLITRINDVRTNQEVSTRFLELQNEARGHRRAQSETEIVSPLQKIKQEGFSLSPAAPNPFSNSTSIEYELPFETKRAEITLYNSKGTLVRRWDLAENVGSLSLSSDGLVPGSYFYRLSADGVQLATQKLVLVE